MIYSQLLRFLLPLIVTLVVTDIGRQVMNGGMARIPRATETLAAFGLAWFLVDFLVSPLLQTRQLGLVLVDGRHSYRRVLIFVLLAGVLLSCVLASLVLTPLGNWVLEGLHGVDQSLASVARTALLWLSPVPVLRGLTLLYSGLLIRIHRTDMVSYATFANIGASILAVFLLLPSGLVQATPIWLPILVTYAGTCAELAIIGWGSRSHTRKLRTSSGAEKPLSYVLAFFWPLALIMAIQGLSRPLINLFIAREADGARALAVLTIVYALAHLPYGWLNEIRNLPTAFQHCDDSLHHIRRFALQCGLLSFAIMVLLFWTPLRDLILSTLIGVGAELTAQAALPLVIFSFFPLVVMVRAYLHGVGLFEHRTRVMAPSAPSRVIAIVVVLTLLPALGIHGATRGVAALLFGFLVETLVVWWGVRGRPLIGSRARSFADQIGHKQGVET
jgi:hypothetical protein